LEEEARNKKTLEEDGAAMNENSSDMIKVDIDSDE